MLRSMTGYGKALAESPEISIKAEFKAVNNKFLELNLRLPRTYQERELHIKNRISPLLERGTVTLNVQVDNKGEGRKKMSVNKELAKEYHREIKKVGIDLKVKPKNMMEYLFSLPEVISFEERETDEEEWRLLNEALDKALKEFDEFRKTEGAQLEKALLSYVDNIESWMKVVDEEEPKRIQDVREKLNNKLQEWTSPDQVDNNRLEQELVYYLEKLDIAEEKTRLRSHCEFFRATVKESSSGKKLGFISQEMGREINTMGAKANNFKIQQAIVNMKEELEKIKEQVLNIV